MELVRLYEPGDHAACLSLLQRGHHSRFTAERFSWLHERGPCGPSHKIVCEADGRIVGLYSVLPRHACLDGKIVIAGRDVDPVVDPAWRGKGLFTRMLEWSLSSSQAVDIYYNFANRASAAGFRKCGWETTEILVDHAVQLGFDRIPSSALLLWAASRFARPRFHSFDVREMAPEEVRYLPDPIPPPKRRFFAPRTGSYLYWRFVQSPIHRYQMFARFDSSEIIDLLVVKLDPGSNRLLIVDFAVYGPDGGALAGYLKYLKRRFGNVRVAVWSTIPTAWRRGFLKSPRARGLPMLVRPAPGFHELDPSLTPGDSFITYGDIEAY